MHRRLVLLRHARAVPAGPGSPDHERPLEPEGWHEAAATARALRALGWAPDRIVSSDARRTRETWAACAGVWPELPAAEPTRRLYDRGASAALDVVACTPDAECTVWVIGHNPTIEDLVARLTGRPAGMGTAYAALLESDAAPWAAAIAGRWRLAHLVRPEGP